MGNNKIFNLIFGKVRGKRIFFLGFYYSCIKSGACTLSSNHNITELFVYERYIRRVFVSSIKAVFDCINHLAIIQYHQINGNFVFGFAFEERHASRALGKVGRDRNKIQLEYVKLQLVLRSDAHRHADEDAVE